MAKALYITVLESCKTLKSLLRTAKSWERPRLIMLLEMQKAGEASFDVGGVQFEKINGF